MNAGLDEDEYEAVIRNSLSNHWRMHNMYWNLEDTHFLRNSIFIIGKSTIFAT